MKRQLGSVLVDADEITHATSLAERHPEQRTDKRRTMANSTSGWQSAYQSHGVERPSTAHRSEIPGW